jgi:hypothetical protein
MEMQARLLAVDIPCDQVSQCGLVSFIDPTQQCAFPVYKPYSLVSPTAASAKAAAQQQLGLAAQARALSQQTPVPCPAIAIVPPKLSCTASKCQTVQ